MPRRAFVDAPEVQNFWEVDDFLRTLAGSQDEIVVLRNAQGFVKAADVSQQLGAKAHHVHDVGLCAWYSIFFRSAEIMSSSE